MPEGLKICVNTQTPLFRFKQPELLRNTETAKPFNMESLKEEVDFEFTPGGVTKMVLPLLTHLLQNKAISNPHWVCLNAGGPPTVLMDGITFHHVSLIQERTSGYGIAKEIIWRVFHGLSRPSQGQLWEDNFVDYTYYNRLSAELVRSLDATEDFDLFYIHDFQQLPVGHMLQTLKPTVLRWHIPFEETMIPSEWSSFLSTYLNSYDAVIVSSRRYMNSLKSLGYTGESYYVYPYIDQSVYSEPTLDEITEVKSRLDLKNDAKLILMVARLDPMKGQDAVIKAMPAVLNHVGNAKLVVVGNGSFSSSRQGLGLSKSDKWLTELRGIARAFHVEDNVVFAGYLPQRLLNAAYAACGATVLPSRQEGFGLVVVESWLYKKPAVVSTKAGIAELIQDGKNGLLVDPMDSDAIAEKISTVLNDKNLAHTLGENGFVTSRKCLIDEGLRTEWEIISKLA
jgi:glycosyltransferase involved in cell wall biosynthesis